MGKMTRRNRIPSSGNNYLLRTRTHHIQKYYAMFFWRCSCQQHPVRGPHAPLSPGSANGGGAGGGLQGKGGIDPPQTRRQAGGDAWRSFLSPSVVDADGPPPPNSSVHPTTNAVPLLLEMVRVMFLLGWVAMSTGLACPGSRRVATITQSSVSRPSRKSQRRLPERRELKPKRKKIHTKPRSPQ